MKFSVFQLSRQGVRAVNEDRVGYCSTPEAALFLLADGMGGHAEGEVAAQLALQSLVLQFQREALPTLRDPTDFLVSGLMRAHRCIQRYAAFKQMKEAPRTTLVAALVQNGTMTWLHCGDSRLYWVRKGQLLVRTRDHSYSEREDAENIPKHLAKHLLNRNVLFTCLGASSTPIFDIAGPYDMGCGDRVLLCSDGLWGVLNEVFLVHVLSKQPIHDAIATLVEAALHIAGEKSDNVTAVGLAWESQNHVSNVNESLADVFLEHEVFVTNIQSEYDLKILDDSSDAEVEPL